MNTYQEGSGTYHPPVQKRKSTVKAKKPPVTPAPKPRNTSSSKTQKKAEKIFREKEFVCEANATCVADPNIRSNQTIEIKNVGKVMSGIYYVEMVRHVWSKDGYTQELELKSNTAGGLKKTIHPPYSSKNKSSGKKSGERTYKVKPGDTLWDIARRFYKSGSKWTRIWNANKSMLIRRDSRNAHDPGHWIYPGQVLVIP